MTPTLKEDLDLNFLTSAAKKILGSSGLMLTEAPDEAERIIFFATTKDHSKTVGVTCSIEENAFALEELKKLIDEGKSLGCQSLMVISSSTFSPEEAEWAANNAVALVDRPRFLHTFEQLPESVRKEVEESARQTEFAPEESPEDVETAAVAEEENSEAGHHQPLPTEEKPVKKKRWVPVVIILVALFVILPVVGIVAAIAIPTIVGLKNDADKLVLSGPQVTPPGSKSAPSIKSPPKVTANVATAKPGIDAKYPTPGIKPGPQAKPTPAKSTAQAKPTPAKAKPTPQAKLMPQAKPTPDANPVLQAKPVVPAKPTPQKKVTIAPKAKPQNPIEFQLSQDDPVWKATGQKEVRQFLFDLWNFEKLVDDPFFDLSEAILIQNTGKSGPLDSGTEMAMFVLPRKLEEYPELGCAALTILSPNDRSLYIGKLDDMIRKLDDPMLLLQFLALKAESSQSPADVEEALKSLQIVLQPEEADPLSDHLAFYLLGKDFVRNLPDAAPDRFLTIVSNSPIVPGWLKDYLKGQKL